MVNNPAAGELFIGGVGRMAELNGRPIAPARRSHWVTASPFLDVIHGSALSRLFQCLDRLLRAGIMFIRSGSGALGLLLCGRLIGYVEAHIYPWDCLGAIEGRSAGVSVNDYVSENSLLHGGSIVAGSPQVFNQLVAVLETRPEHVRTTRPSHC